MTENADSTEKGCKENTIEWVPLSHSGNAFHGYFNRIYKSVFNNKAGKLVEITLKKLGMKIIETPKEIRQSVKESGIEFIPQCDPNSTIVFLKSFAKASENKCKLGQIETPLSNTVISSTEALTSLLGFLMTEKSFPNQIEGIPLCLTADGILRIFQKERLTYCSEMSCVLIGSLEKFLHPDLVWMMSNQKEFFDSCILNTFSMQNLVDEIPNTFKTSLFAANTNILWNKHMGSPCPTSSIRDLFLFIYDMSFDGDFQLNYDLFKINLQKLKDWSFLPSKTKFSQPIFHLIPISFSSRLLYRSHGNEPVNEILDKFNLPTLDESTFRLDPLIYDDKRRSLVYKMQELLPSTQKPCELLNCLIHYVSKLRSTSLSCQECLQLLTYFKDHLDKMKEIENHSSLKLKLKQLPLYLSHQQEPIDLFNRRDVIVLPKGMPADGIREWAEQTEIVLLDEVENLTEFYQFLNLTQRPELEVYIHNIMPNIHCLPRDHWQTHLQYMKDTLLVTSWQQKLNDKQKILVLHLKRWAFIQINGTDKRVQDLYDPANDVFACMVDENCFLPPNFRTEEWINFMELLGLIREPTDEMLLEFAMRIARHAHSPITDQVRQQSEALVCCLFEGTWDINTLHRIKNVQFVVPFEVDPTRKAVFDQPGCGNMLIPLSGSISCEFEDFCWSTVHLFKKMSIPEIKMKELEICEKPPIQKVVQHCQNVCDRFKQKLQEQSIEVAFVKKQMELMYTCLAQNFDPAMKQQFQATPIIFLPEDEDMATVKKVVLSASEDEEIKPFLYKLPTCFGPFDKFFFDLGSDKSVRCAHYAVVLEDVWNEFKDKTLPANMLEVVKRAIENLVRLLEKEDKSLENVKKLYLPDQNRKLVQSTILTVANNADIKDRLDRCCGLKFFIGFREIEISSVRDLELPFLLLPDSLRPELLTNVITEEVSVVDVKIEDSLEARKIESFIRCPQLVEGIVRLVKHQMKLNADQFESQQEKRIIGNLSNVTMKKVTGLKTYLTYKGKIINGTERQAVCFVKTQKNDNPEDEEAGDDFDVKTELYFQCDHSENTLECLIEEKQGLTKVIDICTRDILGKDMSRNVISILRFLENPSKIRKKLDELFIVQYDLPQANSMSVFPRPGTYVEEKFYPFLQHAIVRFKRHEFRFVALEIEENDGNEMDEKNRDAGENRSDDPDLLYMYAHVIEEVHKEENMSDLLATYRIDVGRRCKDQIIVPIHRLYKFKPKEQEKVNAVELYDIEPIGTIPIDENFRRIRQTLIEAWSSRLDEKSRRRVIRRLKIRWHPDRNDDHREYALRVFNYIGEIVLKLERGEIVCEETNDFTGRTAPNMSGSSYCGTSSSASKRGKTYARGFKENINDYNRSTRSGYYAHYRSEEAIVRHVGEAKRWLKQAQQDFVAAKTNLSTADHDQSYNWICYKCHQASEKALKAAWFSKNANRATTKEHSLASLARDLDDGSLLEKSIELERIIGDYFKLRYPDAFSDRQAIPSERITKDQANDSLKVTKEILDMARDFIA